MKEGRWEERNIWRLEDIYLIMADKVTKPDEYV